MKRHAPAVLAAAGVLAAAAAGCSPPGGDGPKNSGPHTGATSSALAVVKVARVYQEAANRLDWRTACGLSSPGLRGGTVEKCVASNIGVPSSTPTPEQTTATPSFTAGTYADGSTPAPQSSATTSGPDRATTGPVTVSDVVSVPAVEDHPAGYGVLVTFTVTWPGEVTTTRRALRLVAEGGAWVVDQHEDVQEGDTGHGSPVRTALTGG